MLLKLIKPITYNGRLYYSYLHNPGKAGLQYLTLGKLIQKSAEKFADNHAIVSTYDNKIITYAEVLKKCDKLAAGLLNIGLKKGDRVGVWCPNLSEWLIMKYASARIGLIMVALNPSYEAPEIEYCINKVGIKCIICPDKVKKNNFYEKLNKVIPNLQDSEVGKINSNKTRSLNSIITISNENLKGSYNYYEIADCSNKDLIEEIKKNQDSINPDKAFSILFSSGTTGKPKAAILSHFAHVNNALDIGRRLELDKKFHKICMMVPLFHAFGMTITSVSSFCYGSTVVLPSPTYNCSLNLTVIKEEKCTMIHGTPTMHLDLVIEQEKRNENISAEIALSGGAPISSHQFKTMLRVLKLKSVKSIYGLTETTAMVFFSNPGDDEEKSTTTVGYMGENMEIKVVDKDGQIVPFGSIGELCVRGYQNMIGYWDDEIKTKETIGSDGWLKTGDKFIITEDGYGKIVGRIKDMIIRGGENIFPKEIEDILITHPDIEQVCVIGLPHERLGEEVCACIKFKSNTEITSEEIIKFCQGKMAKFKIPTQLRFVDDFPKTTSGKIQKYLLVEQFQKK